MEEFPPRIQHIPTLPLSKQRKVLKGVGPRRDLSLHLAPTHS